MLRFAALWCCSLAQYLGQFLQSLPTISKWLNYIIFSNLKAYCYFCSFRWNLLMPISKIDENMKRAQERDAVINQRFWWRKDIFTACRWHTAHLYIRFPFLSPMLFFPFLTTVSFPPSPFLSPHFTRCSSLFPQWRHEGACPGGNERRWNTQRDSRLRLPGLTFLSPLLFVDASYCWLMLSAGWHYLVSQ